MRNMEKILELAKTRVVIRVYYSIMFSTEVELLCGFGKDSFGHYQMCLNGDTMLLTSDLTILNYEDAEQLKDAWVHGGGRDWAPDDFRWLEDKTFIATSVGTNSHTYPNYGILGPYHETSQQVLAILIARMMSDYELTEGSIDEDFYKTALLRLRSMINNINQRQSERGGCPRLLFAKDARF